MKGSDLQQGQNEGFVSSQVLACEDHPLLTEEQQPVCAELPLGMCNFPSQAAPESNLSISLTILEAPTQATPTIPTTL